MRVGWEENGSPDEHVYALGRLLAAAAAGFMSLQARESHSCPTLRGPTGRHRVRKNHRLYGLTPYEY